MASGGGPGKRIVSVGRPSDGDRFVIGANTFLQLYAIRRTGAVPFSLIRREKVVLITPTAIIWHYVARAHVSRPPRAHK